MEQSAQAQIQELEPGSGKHAQLYGEGKTGRRVGRCGEDYPGACAGRCQRFAIGVVIGGAIGPENVGKLDGNSGGHADDHLNVHFEATRNGRPATVWRANQASGNGECAH